MGGVATPVVIRDNFGKIKAIPGQSGLKQISGTQVRNPGLSQRFRDSWQLAMHLGFHNKRRFIHKEGGNYYFHLIIHHKSFSTTM